MEDSHPPPHPEKAVNPYKMTPPCTGSGYNPAGKRCKYEKGKDKRGRNGYQNDRETNAAYAIELARRDVVVLYLDEYGHGFSEPGRLCHPINK